VMVTETMTAFFPTKAHHRSPDPLWNQKTRLWNELSTK
jgi:hypothetical protein